MEFHWPRDTILVVNEQGASYASATGKPKPNQMPGEYTGEGAA